MRTLAIIISMVVAAAIAAYISVGLGVLIALACVGYQVILEYQRSTSASTGLSVWGAVLRDIVRIVVFLIPIVYALLNNSWPVVLATVVVYGVNLYMS